MADYIFIGGDMTTIVDDLMRGFGDINIKQKMLYAKDLTKILVENGGAFLHGIDAIILLDYGFTSSNYLERAIEYVELQEAIRVSTLKNSALRLYLVTKDTNLYQAIDTGANGLPGKLYEYAEVYLINYDITNKLLVDVYKGNLAKSGIYHPKLDKLSTIDKIEQIGEEVINDRRKYSENIKNYGKYEAKTTYTELDYADSALSKQDRINRQKMAEREAKKRDMELKRKSRNKRIDSGYDIEHSSDIELTINIPRRDMRGRQEPEVSKKKKEGSYVARDTELARNYRKELEEHAKSKLPVFRNDEARRRDTSIKSLQNVVEKLQVGQSTLKGKLNIPNGVISIVSPDSVGASGLVANFADVLGVNGKKVLIVDLDIYKKSQQRFFPQYDSKVADRYGLSDGLIKAVEGGNLATAVVDLTSRVSMLGISEKVDIIDDWVDEIIEGLDLVINDARNYYDIILLDCPKSLFIDYLPVVNKVTDKHIFVIDNKWYNVKNFTKLYLRQLLKKHPTKAVELFSKSIVCFNQYKRGLIDDDGKVVGQRLLKQLLLKTGAPYDRIQVALDELPYFDEWERQHIRGTRYIWLDDVAKGLYKNFLGKLTWVEKR